MYRGKAVDEMTPEEMREALETTLRLLSESYDRQMKTHEMYRFFREHRPS